MEDKIIAQCSNCQAQFKLDRDKIGKKIRCPKCANVFVVEESKPKTEAKIITQCSNCQAQFKLDRDKIGKKIRCPKCANVFVVEEVKAEPKPAATPTAPKAAPIPQIPTPKAAPTPPTKKAPAAPLAKEESVPAAKTVIPLDQRTRPLKVRDFMETQYTRFIPEKAQGVDAHISYDFGDEGGQWTVIIKNGECEIKEGADPTAKSHVKMKAETYLKIATDQLDSRVAFMLGKLKIKGDKQSVATFRECFQKTGLKTWK